MPMRQIAPSRASACSLWRPSARSLRSVGNRRKTVVQLMEEPHEP